MNMWHILFLVSKILFWLPTIICNSNYMESELEIPEWYISYIWFQKYNTSTMGRLQSLQQRTCWGWNASFNSPKGGHPSYPSTVCEWPWGSEACHWICIQKEASWIQEGQGWVGMAETECKFTSRTEVFWSSGTFNSILLLSYSHYASWGIFLEN